MGSSSSIDDQTESADHTQSTGIAFQPSRSHGTINASSPHSSAAASGRNLTSSYPSMITTDMRSWI